MRFKKKLLKTIFALSFVTVGGLSLPAFSPVSASEASVLESVVGQSLDVDGFAGGQCWDLTNYYLISQGSGGIYGGSSRAGLIGNDFYYQLVNEGFEVIFNPSLSQVQPGDVVNLHPGAGGSDAYYGHTFVVKNVFANGVIQTYEQNAELGQIVAVYNRTYPEGAISSIIRKAGTTVAKPTKATPPSLGVDTTASRLPQVAQPQYYIQATEETEVLEEIPTEPVDTRTEEEKEQERIAKTNAIVEKIKQDVHFIEEPKSILNTQTVYSKADGNVAEVDAVANLKTEKTVLNTDAKILPTPTKKISETYLDSYKQLVTDTTKELEGVVSNTKTENVKNETSKVITHETTDVNDGSQATEVVEVKDDVNGGTSVEEKQDVNKNEVHHDEEKAENAKVSPQEPKEAVSYIDTEILPLAG